jgi:hypothetical protein
MTRTTWASIVLIALAVALVVVAAVYRERHVEARTGIAYTPTATIKDLMDSIVDPSADVVWNAVSTTVGNEGAEEKMPHTDDEWVEVRRGAIRLVEAANLLMVPGRHVARPGEKSETPNVELEPTEMEALVNKNHELWVSHVQKFQAASLEALKAVDAKNSTRLFEIGSVVDAACESCHREYWYPNEQIPDFPTDPNATQTFGVSQSQ